MENPDFETAEKPPARRRLPRLPMPPNFNLWGVIRFGLVALGICWCVANYHADIPLGALFEKYHFPDSKTIEIDGTVVHYRDSGQGQKTILLLHSDAGSLQTWANWTKIFAPDHRVISIDLPGFGLTGPNARGSYSTYAYLVFLEKFMDLLGLKNVRLVGNGMGGQIAAFYAADHPEHLEKLVLIDAFGYPNDRSRSIGSWFVQLPVLGEIAEKITPKSLFKQHLEALWANDAAVTDSIVSRDFDLFLREGNRAAWADRTRVEDNHPPAEQMKKIGIPTLILWGAEDTQVPTGNERDLCEGNGIDGKRIESATARLRAFADGLQREVLEQRLGGAEAALPMLGCNAISPQDPLPMQQSVQEFSNRQRAALSNLSLWNDNNANYLVRSNETVGPLVPVWLDSPNGSQLVFARRVRDTAGSRLQGVLVDDSGRPLSDAALERIGAQLAQRYESLDRAGFAAGSPIALRLFN